MTKLVAQSFLGNEVGLGEPGGGAHFDRDGWVVGRDVLPVDLVREARRPVVELLLDQDLIEAAPDHDDRFRWVGDPAALDRIGLNALNANEPLVAPGHARRAVEALWERPAALWTNTGVFLMPPRAALDADTSSANGHRDGWQPLGTAEPGAHFNFWIPLTQFEADEGSLALVPGSHAGDDEPETIPGYKTARGETITAYGFRPERFAGQWRATWFDVGDARLFRPDLIHAGTDNAGADVRMAIVVRGQDGRIPLPPAAGLSSDRTQRLSTVEACTLAALVLASAAKGIHGIWLLTSPRGPVGRYRAFPNEAVSRAVELLQERGLVEARLDDGLNPRYVANDAGRRAAHAWLEEPVADIQELPSLVALKFDLLAALKLGPAKFVAAQRQELDRLAAVPEEGPIRASWRASLVEAARGLLGEPTPRVS